MTDLIVNVVTGVVACALGYLMGYYDRKRWRREGACVGSGGDQ